MRDALLVLVLVPASVLPRRLAHMVTRLASALVSIAEPRRKDR